MKWLLLLITPVYIFAAATFITEDEYASSLYKNPRGIGCDKCHGDDGKGLLIAKYVSKGVEKEFKGPDITALGFKKFYEALDTRKSGMPRYFLTRDEIETLYKYIHKEKK